jgi:hypothetical protein
MVWGAPKLKVLVRVLWVLKLFQKLLVWQPCAIEFSQIYTKTFSLEALKTIPETKSFRNGFWGPKTFSFR